MRHANRSTLTGLVILLILVLISASAAALDVPPLKGHVNDYAHMLSPGSKRQLEALLTDFERQDSTQIAVLTIPSLKGDSLEDFSIRVADAWKIGQAGSDNGAILLVVKNDRKIRIEVGYGLEGRLTDLVSGRIIRNVIAPQFKNGNFNQGIADGVSAMIQAVKGEYSGSDQQHPARGSKSRHGTPIAVIIALFFLINALGRVSRFMGAASGGVLAPIAGGLFFGLSPLFLLALIPFGLIGGFLISLFGGPLSLGRTGTRGGGGYWGGGFGGGGFGGGLGGGGFSSGGFGGFSGGGGGFGGGGASGGW